MVKWGILPNFRAGNSQSSFNRTTYLPQKRHKGWTLAFPKRKDHLFIHHFSKVYSLLVLHKWAVHTKQWILTSDQDIVDVKVQVSNTQRPLREAGPVFSKCWLVGRNPPRIQSWERHLFRKNGSKKLSEHWTLYRVLKGSFRTSPAGLFCGFWKTKGLVWFLFCNLIIENIWWSLNTKNLESPRKANRFASSMFGKRFTTRAGQTGGGSFKREKNFHRMCAERPRSAMPKPRFLRARPFDRSMWWWLGGGWLRFLAAVFLLLVVGSAMTLKARNHHHDSMTYAPQT